MRNHDHNKELDDLLRTMPKPNLHYEKKATIKKSIIEQSFHYEHKRKHVIMRKRLSYGLASIATLALFSFFLITSLNGSGKEEKQNAAYQSTEEKIYNLEPRENVEENEQRYFLNSGFQQFDEEGNIVYVNKQVGFKLKNLGGGASNFEYEIAKTIDGGKTWIAKGTTRLSHVTGLSFINEDTGFLVNNSPAFEVSPTLIVTQNGGKDWKEQQLPIPADYKDFYRQAKFPVFFTNSVGVLPVFGFKNDEGNSFLYMLITNDGGATWQAITENQMNDLTWTENHDQVIINYQNRQIEIN